MRKTMQKLTAVLLALCLLAGSCVAVFASGFDGYDPITHRDLTSSDLQYKGWDDDKFDALLEQLEAMDASTPDIEFQSTYEQILYEFDELYNQYVLADAAYYADVNDTWAAEDSDEMFEKLHDAEDDFFLAMQRILHGPKGKLLEGQLKDLWIDWIETYIEESDELDALLKEENRLVQEYYSAIAEADGTASSDGDYYEKINELCGPIFLDLLQVRDEIADWNGYDNYYEYAFDSYGRDYDPEDIEALSKIAKEKIVPLFYEIYETWWDLPYPESVEEFYDEEEILAILEPYIGEIHPALSESYEYLRRNKTYDIEWSEKKASTGYTDNLPAFHAAFIFNSPYDNYQDYSDLVHEFGHYNAAFHDPTPAIYMTSVLDVAEIHSQALELLITRYAEDLYGEDAPFMTIDAVFRILSSVLSGCMYDEFQKTVYENPDMTLEEIDDLAEELCFAYGMDGSGYERYDWIDVSHNFDMPCYYVSYATSAISALDIWTQSLEDWGSAVDRYMQVTALPSDTGYMEAVKACGLMDFTKKNDVIRLVNNVRYFYDTEYRDWADPDNGGKNKDNPINFPINLPNLGGKTGKVKSALQSVLKALLIVAVVATVLVIALIALLWKKHKGEEITNQTPPNPGYTEDTSETSSIYQESDEE
ncbi:MAG: hypothetical protein IKW92_01650 [Firmicutes bacterium]|nr:hypothetical protein [Bacillota bacterium]